MVTSLCASTSAVADPLGPTGVVNTNAASDTGDDDSPAMAMDGQNNVIVVWTSNDSLGGTIGTDADILIARSTDRGATWSPPLPISPSMAVDADDDRRPSIATNGAGVWIVVWESSTSFGGSIGSDRDILFVRSTDFGATWSAPAPLNTNAAIDTGDDGWPRIATDRAGRWMVVWSSNDTLGGTIGADDDILLARSTDQGATWSAPVAIAANAATDTGDDRRPVVASDEVGTWIVGWSSNDSLGGTTGNDRDILFSRSTDQGATWSVQATLNTNAASDTGDDDGVDIAGDGAGRWIAAWHSFEPAPWGPDGDILVTRSANNGGTWTPPAALYSFALIELGDEFDPRIITDRRGTWMIVWWREDSLPGSTATDVDVLLARSTNNGAGWVGPEPINFDALADVGDDYRPVAATSRNNDWIVVWASDDPLGGTVGTDLDIFAAITICGDGVLQANEECDDGNVLDGDCCSSTCGLVAAGTVCRASAGVCDVAETCDGVSGICPPDVLMSAGTSCRASAGACDIEETCSGSDPDCPPDDLRALGELCRASAGPCDVAESCDGMTPLCPDDAFMTAGTSCRPALGDCDLEDTCSGTSADCVNEVQPSGTMCRAAADLCDQPEVCDGVAISCPPDAFLPAGTVCRAAADLCDQAEVCSGTSMTCPADAIASAGTVCRPAATSCDAPESCDGITIACPADLFLPDGTQCLDMSVCNGSERCEGGVCVAGAPLACDDGQGCTIDGCFEPGGCGAIPIEGCCVDDGDCDDGNACTTDSCSNGTCTNTTIAECCNNSADCEDGDACTVDVCSGPGGTCSSSRITGCCTTDAHCDDGSSCTSDACNLTTNQCVYGPIPGCCERASDCDDSNPCTTDECDETGSCVRTPIPECCVSNADCDDGVTCTSEMCVANTCTSTVVANCCTEDSECGTSGDVCTIDRCNPTTNRCERNTVESCCTGNDDCAPDLGCSATVCDLPTNTCLPEVVPGCCNFDSDCDDFDPCTVDTCAASACVHTEIEDCTIVVPDGGMPDAEPMNDAGVKPDADLPPIDGGAPLDAAVSPDGGAPMPDAGTPPDAGGFTLDDDSCECTSHTRRDAASSWWMIAFVCAALLLRRRR